ncbi:MAG: hypothetical protein AAFO69_17235, partial [Bacteroidota bacterium]
MRKNLRYMCLMLVCTFLVASCNEDELVQQRLEDNPVDLPVTSGDPGSLDLTHYVALGNSLTAGFMDFALYNQGQASAFPNLLAQQFALSGVGGGDFNQPDINSTNGFNSAFSDPANGVILGRTELSLSQRAPLPTMGELPTAYTGDKAELNNFGVPGILLGQLLTPATGTPGSALENGLYTRFATAPGTSTILGDAIATSPTFFSLWAGNNDVLAYATSGGAGPVPITDAATFQEQYTAVIQQLVATGSKGVVLNIPPVLLIPFFRAVPWNAVPLDQANADALNAAYADYNNGLQTARMAMLITEEEATRRTISFTASAGSAFVMEDENLTDLSALGLPSIRLTEATDLVLFTAASALSQGVGTMTPAGDQFVLSFEEQVEIITAVATFNAIIGGIVQQTNATVGSTVVTMFDIQPLFSDIAGLSAAQATQLALSPGAIAAADGQLGLVIDGVSYAPDFTPSGIFSTDGVH